MIRLYGTNTLAELLTIYRLAIISAQRFYLTIASGLVLHRCYLSCVYHLLLPYCDVEWYDCVSPHVELVF